LEAVIAPRVLKRAARQNQRRQPLHARWPTLAAEHRRTFSNLIDDGAEMGTHVQKFIREQFNEWKTDLTVGWRKNKFREQPLVTASSVPVITRCR
jgi:hypothetical protein